MSERERLYRFLEGRDPMQLDEDGNYYIRHVEAMTGEGLYDKSDIAAELGWRDREIDRAEQREAELVQSLKAAKCPQCDGSGAVQVGPDDICQCQWCHERDAILAKYKCDGTASG